jgi:hypothetical protein
MAVMPTSAGHTIEELRVKDRMGLTSDDNALALLSV